MAFAQRITAAKQGSHARVSAQRLWSKRGWALIAIVSLVLVAPAARAGDELTFVSWGGAYTRSQMLAFVRPYEHKTGVSLNVLDYAGGLDDIRSQVRSLNVKWDVVDLELSDAIRGCDEGLLERISPSDLSPGPDGQDPSHDFIPGGLTPCAVGTVVWSTVIAYDTRRFKNHPPRSLRDFFDLKRFPGRRGLRKTPKGNLEWALIASGVPPGQVYKRLGTEQGLERAFAMLDRIKPAIVWWTAGAEAPRMLETGRVAMASAYNGRIYDAAKTRNAPLRIIWDHQIWNIDLLAIPKGDPKRKQALNFIRFATAPAQLAAQARYIPYGPVRRSALAQVPADVRAHLPTAQKDFSQALRINAAWWAKHFEQVDQRFQDWLEQPVQVPRRLPR
ncbi:MAG TPA: polyamine ABC transporter substrate-binding protein [Gammaproteobacteria bacterium]|nr:polyamine ABC transporter substrate-binding protein [Gammaproteobacteria bacterium]